MKRIVYRGIIFSLYLTLEFYGRQHNSPIYFSYVTRDILQFILLYNDNESINY